MDIGYQEYALEKLQQYDNSILIWFRQSGKTTILIKYILSYILDNTYKKVLVISARKDSSLQFQTLLNNRVPSGATSKRIQFKSKILDNEFFFESVNTYKKLILSPIKFDLILIDDFDMVKDYEFVDYIKRHKCKSIFCASQFMPEMVLYIDKDGKNYINFVSYSAVATRDEVETRTKQYGAGILYSVQNEFGSLTELYNELGVKKDRSLIDVWGLKEQRMRKLKEISKKIKNDNES